MDGLMNDNRFVEASMYFLQRDPKYDNEKPYSLRFSPGNSLARSNILRERHEIKVHNMRDVPDLGIDDYGFEILPFSSTLTYSDFATEGNITGRFLPEMARKLRDHLKAAYFVPIDFVVMKT
ncbi:hypothetical protein N7488_011570 [Penicillium malachiteum]|nr:hypothetical protein N7488_011570 [Penicillium malachiteum]